MFYLNIFLNQSKNIGEKLHVLLKVVLKGESIKTHVLDSLTKFIYY